MSRTQQIVAVQKLKRQWELRNRILDQMVKGTANVKMQELLK